MQSRSALDELHAWMLHTHEHLDRVEHELKSFGDDGGVSDNTTTNNTDSNFIRELDDAFGKHLERARHDLAELSDAIRSKRDRELSFVVDAIELEIRQGFYDLKTSETCTQVQFEWAQLKQRIKNLLDTIELSAIKVFHFCNKKKTHFFKHFPSF